MTGRPQEIGSVGQAVAQRIRVVREARRMTYREVSQLLARNGRDINPVGVRRVEECQRRVDVDDAVAFAAALEVPAAELMGIQRARKRVRADPGSEAIRQLGPL